ncbi:MAG: YeeE/YedE thiosulfate transporter family protein [Acidiferrobacterales bacterium]
MKHHLRYGFFGLFMGFVIARIGFADYGEVHRLFTLVDLRMLITFAGAVLFAMIGFMILARNHNLQEKFLHKGTIPGGMMFGTGWAITGSCPSIALVQLGAGYLPAIVTMVGILIGAWTYKVMNGRVFYIDSGACET